MLAVSLLAAGPGSRAYREGREAEKAGRYGAAYLLYSQAFALEPTKADYRARAESVRRQGIMQLEIDQGPGAAVPDEPAEAMPPIEDGDLKESAAMLPPPVLVGAAGARDFDLKGDAKQLWEKVLAPYGLEAVFDSDFVPGAQVQFRLSNADWRTAIRSLEAVTGAFIVPLGDRLGIVVKDTVQKRSEMERHMTVALPIPTTLSAQEVQEVARAVQSTFDIQKFGIDTSRGIVLLKDRASRIKPAIELFRQLTVHRAQVLLEMELVNLGETSSLRLGMSLPTSFPIVNLSTAWNNSPSVPSAIGRLLTFGSGRWMFGIGLSGAELFASMTKGESTVVARSEILTVNGQAATMHVGDRYPIQTQSYQATVGAADGAYTPAPAIQFEDLGVVLKVTPYAHGSEEMTLEIEAEFKVLAGTALNGIPVISNRKIQSRVRMKFGETAVIAGLTSGAVRRSMSGLPGLIALPPFRSNERSSETADLLLTIRPRLTGLAPSETATWPIWAGTETRPLTPLN